MDKHIRGYVPIEYEGKMRCQWLWCAAGMGIAGNGRCFLGGHWWMKDCPEYQPFWAYSYEIPEKYGGES